MSIYLKHRKSIRLVGYDYSKAGLYFVTICCQNRGCLFGEIVGENMILSDGGKIANECWVAIPKHFKNVVLHEYIIMPNHVHGIIEITPVDIGTNQHSSKDNENVSAKNLSPDNVNIDNKEMANVDSPLRQEFKSPSKTIGSIIRGYKIGVTKWFHSNTEIDIVWQRNYYEHIIRDRESYQTISSYIFNNPVKWNEDKFFRNS
jgi:REP element-mobilizing transposase RayT